VQREQELVNILRQSGVELTTGLTGEEIAQVESKYSFRFPPDLRAFLQAALPVSPAFPNWRGESEESLRGRLDWPAHGICFDIEHNDFWWEEWGPRPLDLQQAFEVARHEISKAPTLIPIYSHRYLPDEPNQKGNPVFSVYQTDIIYYGTDLTDYFAEEFSHNEGKPILYEEVRRIRLWSELVEAYGVTVQNPK
jgi:hypothetical protein